MAAERRQVLTLLHMHRPGVLAQTKPPKSLCLRFPFSRQPLSNSDKALICTSAKSSKLHQFVAFTSQKRALASSVK